MRRKEMIMILTAASILLTGCNVVQQGTDDLPESKHAAQNTEVDHKVENIIDQKAKEVHVAPELSDDFVSKYLNMDSFDELKRRTKEGIEATNKESDLTKKEVILWQDLIKEKMVQQYTTNDLEANKKELNDALNQMAKEHQMSMKDFLSKIYDMNEAETESFVEKQAQKFVTEENEEGLTESSEENMDIKKEDSGYGGNTD